MKPTGLPASNVLYYDLEDGAWICVRPSGTEPLLRVMVEGKDEELIQKLAEDVAQVIREELV